MTNLLLFLLAVFVFYLLGKNISKMQSGEHFKNKNGNNIRRDGKPYASSAEELANSEYGLIVALIAKVAKADGRISELEAELISNALDDLCRDYANEQEARGYLKDIFNKEKKIQNLARITDALYSIIYNDYDKRVKIVEFLLNIAFIDGILDPKEEAMMRDIASGLKIKSEDYERFFDTFKQFYSNPNSIKKDTKLESAYQLLKASSSDSDEEIKKKYKEEVKKYHPDIIRGKGLEGEFIELATQKLQDINSAYEVIKKARGIK